MDRAARVSGCRPITPDRAACGEAILRGQPPFPGLDREVPGAASMVEAALRSLLPVRAMATASMIDSQGIGPARD